MLIWKPKIVFIERRNWENLRQWTFSNIFIKHFYCKFCSFTLQKGISSSHHIKEILYFTDSLCSFSYYKTSFFQSFFQAYKKIGIELVYKTLLLKPIVFTRRLLQSENLHIINFLRSQSLKARLNFFGKIQCNNFVVHVIPEQCWGNFFY